MTRIGTALLFLLAITFSGCGAAGSAQDSHAMTPADWVHRGLSLFRSATSVLVLPDADGEGFCAYVQPSCTAYTITQSPMPPPGVVRSCDSIPSCATTFFTPIARSFDFGDSTPTSVEVTGDTAGCEGWCVWRMDFDRSSGVILAVDIYLRGGTHQDWPTWKFRDYVINGSTLATPTPAPTFNPQPPHTSVPTTAS